MAERTRHIIHDTYGDRERRDRIKNGAILSAIGLFLILASIGGVIQKEYKLAFGVLVAGVVLAYFGWKLAGKGKTPKGSVRITYS